MSSIAWVVLAFILLIGLLLILFGIRFKGKWIKVLFIVAGILVLLYGWFSTYNESQPSSVQPKKIIGDKGDDAPAPGEGAKIVAPSGSVNTAKKSLKQATTTGITDYELQSIPPETDLTDIEDKYGKGIIVGMEKVLGDDGYNSVRLCIDYPSVDHEGDQKVVMLFTDSKLKQVLLRTLDWKPTDEDQNFRMMIDDSQVIYY